MSKDKSISRLNLTAKFDSFDMESCWNAKVISAVAKIEKASGSFDMNQLTKLFS